MGVRLRPLGDRVLIAADPEDRAPTQHASGLFSVRSLEAAVLGTDPGESWFSGTVVAIGPLVNRVDIRAYVLRRLRETAKELHCSRWHVQRIFEAVDALPAECPDPVRVGDRVAFSWASGQQIMIDETKYLILRTADLLAVVQDRQEVA